MATESVHLRIWARDEDHASQRSSKMTVWCVSSLLFVGALVLFGSLGKTATLSDSTGYMVKSHLKMKKSKYKATQFISFSINTMGGIAEHGECVGRDVADDGTCYLGSFDIAKDVEQRALLVAGVLDLLKNDKHKKHPNIDPRSDGT